MELFFEQFRTIATLKEADKLTAPSTFRRTVKKMAETSVFEGDELEYFLENLIELYYRFVGNIATLDYYLSLDIRIPISKRFGKYSEEHNKSIKICRLTRADKKKLEKDAINKIKEDQKELIEIDTNQTIDIIKFLNDNDDILYNAVGLLAASGIRPIELFISDITTKKDSNNWIMQSNLAKKRENDDFIVQKPVIGVESNEFVSKFKKVQRELKEKYPNFIGYRGQLLSTINSKLNEVAKKEFSIPNLYQLRKIYAAISYKLYSKDSIIGKKPSQSLWISNVLGHNEDDLSTGNLHYNNFEAV